MDGRTFEHLQEISIFLAPLQIASLFLLPAWIYTRLGIWASGLMLVCLAYLTIAHLNWEIQMIHEFYRRGE